MDNSTVFYVLGAALAASAVVVSFLGLRMERFPGRAAPLVFLCFAILVAAATTFAVRNGKEEQEARAGELAKAGEEVEEAEASPVEAGGGEAASEGGGGGAEAKSGGAAQGPGGILQLAADPSEIAFDTTSLSSKPGKVTIDFDNPATLEHNVAIEQDGKQIAISETIAKGKTSVTADLEPGTYTFLCTVPGHAEAGMEGTLTVR
jgi:plastocyanin